MAELIEFAVAVLGHFCCVARVRKWPKTSVRCDTAIRPEAGAKQTCRDRESTLLTHDVTSPPSIDALRKTHCITSSAMARRLGKNIGPARKRPSNSRRLG